MLQKRGAAARCYQVALPRSAEGECRDAARASGEAKRLVSYDIIAAFVLCPARIWKGLGWDCDGGYEKCRHAIGERNIFLYSVASDWASIV